MRCFTCMLLLLVLNVDSIAGAAEPPPNLTAEQQARLHKAESLLGNIMQFIGQGRMREALPLAKECLTIAKEVFGEKHVNTAIAFKMLGFLYHKMGNYLAARQSFEQALAIRQEVLGEKHPDTLVSHLQLGQVFEALAEFNQAREHYETVLTISREVVGEKHVTTATALNNLGTLLTTTGDYAAAQTYLEEALAINREVLGEKHADTSTSLSNLGALFLETGDYEATKPYYEQALAIRKEVLGEKHPATANSLNNMGFLLQTTGNHVAARAYYEQALAICTEILGQKHPHTAAAIGNLGGLLSAMGDYSAARPYHEQSLAINTEVLGKKHPATARSLNSLGTLCQAMGDFKTAQACFAQSLAIREQVFGNKHPQTATSLNNLGMLLELMTDYEAARPYLERAHAINEGSYGTTHPRTAESLNNLGCLLSDEGDYAGARPYFARALAIRKTILGEKHPDTARSYDNLSAIEAASGHWEEAAANEDQARRTVRRHVARVLPGLSAKEQAKFLMATDSGPFHAALSLGLSRAADPQLVSLSAGWLLNGKALTQEALAQTATVSRESHDPTVGAVVKELRRLRRQLATLTLSGAKPGQEAARRIRLEQLERQEEVLARRLAEANGQVFLSDSWVDIATVRQALPTNAVFIDIARFNVRNFHSKGPKERWQPPRYVAWIISPGGKQQAAKVFDLGEADKIDQAAQEVRTALHAAIGGNGTVARHGEPEAEEDLQELLKRLAQLVLKPIIKEVGDANELIISPDGALWLVPWGALPLDDGRYAIEQYQIRYVVSGRDLVAEHPTDIQINKPIIMADPDYDLSPDKAESVTHAVLGEPQPVENDELRSFEPTASSTALPKFTRLPYTGAEAQLISPKLESYTNETPIVYTDQLALEGIFKAFRNQKVVVLSTHGYFLEDQKAKLDDRMLASTETRGIALTVDGKPIENPLLRCGLLLAGCNRSGEARTTGAEDGVLTGMEIVGTDFRGTELVVLSACETGLGQVHNGEGVAGLRQAFQLAGAQAVVATLWQIPDRESARLMTTFFENLAAGQGKGDALRNAQLDMIQYRRKRHGAAHPFFWAAFTITGE